MLDLNFSLKRGDFTLQVCTTLQAPITGILGASGNGKSTLLLTIAGLIKPHEGFVSLNNVRLSDAQARVWVPPHKRRVGLVFQEGYLLPHLSVRNNLLFGYRNIPPAQRRIELDAVVSVLEIEHFLERKPSTLSGGERQRVALGRALLYSPSLLLLDEPLSALDEKLKLQILPFFLQIYSEFGIPMVYVTHSRPELDVLTNEHLIMRDGRLFSDDVAYDPSLGRLDGGFFNQF